MARIAPRPAEELTELADQFAMTEAMMGFVPNSLPTMARVPGLAEAFSQLGAAVFGNQRVPLELNQMVAQVASSAAGCRYCQAHTAHNVHRLGYLTKRSPTSGTFRPANTSMMPSGQPSTWHCTLEPFPTRPPTSILRNYASTTTMTRSPDSLPPLRCSGTSIAGTTPWPPTSRTSQPPLANVCSRPAAGSRVRIAAAEKSVP